MDCQELERPPISLGNLVLLNRSWQSNEGTLRAIWQELNPRRPSQVVTGPRYRLSHSAPLSAIWLLLAALHRP